MSWLRYARYFCPYLSQLTPNDQTLLSSFFGGFSKYTFMKLVIPVWKDTAGSVKLWEITRGIVIEDYGKVTSPFPFLFCLNCWLHPCNIAYLIAGRRVSCPIIWCINYVTYSAYKIRFQFWHNTDIILVYILTFSRCHLRRKRNNYLKWYDHKILFIV